MAVHILIATLKCMAVLGEKLIPENFEASNLAAALETELKCWSEPTLIGLWGVCSRANNKS